MRATKNVPSEALAKDADNIRMTKFVVVAAYLLGNMGFSLLMTIFGFSVMDILLVMFSFQIILFPISMLEWRRQKLIVRFCGCSVQLLWATSTDRTCCYFDLCGLCVNFNDVLILLRLTEPQ